MTVNESTLGDALTYEDYLPVDLRQVGEIPDPLRLNGLNSETEEALHSILLLERQHTELSEDESDRLTGELSYIDFKLNILLDLIVKVYANQLKIPPDMHTFLSSTGLRCETRFPADIGDKYYADIYLSRRFPRPVIFYGSVIKVERPVGRDTVLIELKFEQMSQTVSNLLDRFIFLKHRRMIASSKRGD